MVVIAGCCLAGRQPEDDDVPMDDAADDELVLPSSSAPPSSPSAQANAGYNHRVLQEHLGAEEQLDAGRAVAPDADLAGQEALLQSYSSAREVRLARWRYRQPVTEVAVASKESDDASEALSGETDDEEEEDIAESTPRREDHEVGTSTGAAGSEED